MLNNVSLKKASGIALLLLLLSATNAALSQPEKYIAGTHYTVLESPVRTGNTGKIEVVEAFWYGCPHCFSFEPLLLDWTQRNAERIEFERAPAIFNNLMKLHAQVFFTAQSLGLLDTLHDAIYEALVLDNRPLQNESQIGEFFASHGVERKAFESAFNSFSVRTKVQQAQSRMQDYKLRGTPSMIVNGKYRVMTGSAVPTQRQMLEVVDFLIDKESNSQ